jgi:hypothetical protein
MTNSVKYFQGLVTGVDKAIQDHNEEQAYDERVDLISAMICQGLVTKSGLGCTQDTMREIAKDSVDMAKILIEELDSNG